MSTTTGPTLHLIVEEQRIGELTDRATGAAFDVINDAKQDIGVHISNATARAYRAGLRDGFAQGAIAESTSSALPRVSVEAATTWPTHHCSRCGFTHGPFPDDNEATEGLRVINAHAAWCPAKDKKATPDAE